MGEQRTAVPTSSETPFRAHVELLRLFVAKRYEIVERIELVLNARRRPVEHRQDRDALWRELEDCFFVTAAVAEDQRRLRGRLQDAHWASGFKPRRSPGMSNDLIDPAELMRRCFHLWTATRWPGRDGRLRFAQTLFNAYLVRQLALLVMRVWDAGPETAAERLATVQALLDELWKSSPSDQRALVRRAGALIPVALSPATEALAPYFEVARHIAEAFSPAERIGILDAVVRMAGGHLRSYLHYYVTQKGAKLDELQFVLQTRRSDALDFSLLIHALVPLLEAYENAVRSGERERRLELADAICQGISSDPELFVDRVDLLGAYSMVEYLFTTSGDGRCVYTPLGRRHAALLEEYAARIRRVSRPLSEDCAHFRPIAGAYSPYGALYGYASNLLEHMTLKALDRDASLHFGLEDVFTAGGADKLEWVSGLRKLPHVRREVAKLYAYPQAFAEQIFVRIEHALQRQLHDASGARRTGTLFLLRSRAAEVEPSLAALADLPIRFIVSSDPDLVAAKQAHAADEARISSDRQEGHFLVSYETANGWVGITKDVLTEVLGAGRDAKLVGLPPEAIEQLCLLGGGLVVSHPAAD